MFRHIRDISTSSSVFPADRIQPIADVLAVGR